jgi:peroxiredoxin
VALLLRRRGLDRVRPLAGGFDAWREHGLPIVTEDGGPSEPAVSPTIRRAANTLDESEVLDERGQPVRLSELWQERPVVLAFVRQFGCVLCRDLVMQLRDNESAFHESGARIVVVGNGQPEAAARFRELFELRFPVLVDPQRRIYDRLGFQRNLGGSANPVVLFAALRAWIRGARQSRTEGDPWQLGGVLIVRPGGEVIYRQASRFAGDHPKIDSLLRALGEGARS